MSGCWGCNGGHTKAGTMLACSIPRARVEEWMDERETAMLFAAVGDPTRLALLRFLLQDEHCVSQCTEYIGLTQGAASKQLATLANAGLLVRRQLGRRAYYQVSDPEAIEGILTAAHALLMGRQQGGPARARSG
jgi:DNA-binding transcriptional ArsR family regulator